MTVLASAANERYGYHLLSMLGSVQRNSDVFERIVVYDLGLNREQRRLLEERGARSCDRSPPGTCLEDRQPRSTIQRHRGATP